MFDRFSDEARRTVVRALVEARRQGHDHVGTGHLLVALVQARGAAGNALASEGLTLDQAQQAAADVGSRGGRVSPWDDGPYTSRVRQVFDLAEREAYEFGHRYLASGHLLLAQLRIGDGNGLRVLDHLGVDHEILRQKVEDSISTERPPIAPSEPVLAGGDADIAAAEALLDPPSEGPAPAAAPNGRTVLSLGDDGPLLAPVAVDGGSDDSDDTHEPHAAPGSSEPAGPDRPLGLELPAASNDLVRPQHEVGPRDPGDPLDADAVALPPSPDPVVRTDRPGPGAPADMADPAVTASGPANPRELDAPDDPTGATGRFRPSDRARLPGLPRPSDLGGFARPMGAGGRTDAGDLGAPADPTGPGGPGVTGVPAGSRDLGEPDDLTAPTDDRDGADALGELSDLGDLGDAVDQDVPGGPPDGLPDDDDGMDEANGHHLEVDLRTAPRVTVRYDEPPELPIRAPLPVGRSPEPERRPRPVVEVEAHDADEDIEDAVVDDVGHASWPGPELEPWQCSFCGRDLGDDDRFVAGGDAVICSGCVGASARLLGLSTIGHIGELDTAGWPDPPASRPPEPPLPRVVGATPEGVSVADVARAFVVALDLRQPDSERAAHVEDGSLLAPVLAWAREQRPLAPLATASTVVDRVRFLNDELALVHFASDLASTAGNGNGPEAGPDSAEPASRPGWARRHPDGWKVTRETYTRLLRDAGLPPL